MLKEFVGLIFMLNKCVICNGDLFWLGDFTYEDCGFNNGKGDPDDVDGIVSMWSCESCGQTFNELHSFHRVERRTNGCFDESNTVL